MHRIIGSRGEWLEANPETAKAFLAATRRGYAFAAENPEAAAEILIGATEGMLGNPELIRASMQAIVDGGYLTDENGQVGTIQPDRIEAVGSFLVDAGILRDEAGDVLTEKPDFSTWFTNESLDR